MTPYRLTVAGPLPRAVTDTVRERFACVSIRSTGEATELQLRADQPALRALLTLLWDVGSDVLSLTPDEFPS